jgi:hypothetical protein
MSDNLHISGQPRQLFASLKNNRLFCCPANPFLDAWFRFMDRSAHQAISAGIYNQLLFIDINAFREKHTYSEHTPKGHSRECRAPRPPALPLLLETPQPTRQFTMREMSLAVLLCMLTLLLSGRHLSPGSGAHLQSHGRDEPGSGKVDRGTDGHSTPRLRCRPSRGRPPRAPQRRSPPACGGTCPAPAPGALHRTKRRGGTETVRDERHGSDRCDRSERVI